MIISALWTWLGRGVLVLISKKNIIKNKTYNTNITADEDILYEKLRGLRLEFAKKLKLPAYVIFPDKTLIEMTKYRPQNLADLEKIYGVGKAKLRKFGKHFLTLIDKN